VVATRGGLGGRSTTDLPWEPTTESSTLGLHHTTWKSTAYAWSDNRLSGVVIVIVTFLPQQVSAQHYGGRRLASYDPALIIMRGQARYVTFYIKCRDLRRRHFARERRDYRRGNMQYVHRQETINTTVPLLHRVMA